MSTDSSAAAFSKPEARGENAQIIATVFITFIGFLSIGLQLAVLPTYVHITLGYSTVMAGFAISIQYIATVLTRSRVGQIADTRGPKLTVVWGCCACLASGALLVASSLFESVPAAGFGLLLASRLLLGVCESLIGTGAIAWAIGRVGPEKTARIIAWNGISTYGALAVGAPLGVAINAVTSFAGIGLAVMGLALAGLALAWPKPATAMAPRDNLLSFRSVLLRVLPHGTALALSTAGFGTITTFVTLFYAARNWQGAAFALSAFGLAFIASRLIFTDLINRQGGFPVAIVSLALQVVGLFTVWQASSPIVALAGAAVTGFGFSLVFPAIGVEAVARVPPANRGAALGLYSMFLDVSLGITGPAAGWISGQFSAATPFLFGAIATLLGLGITSWLALRRGRRLPA